MSQNLTQTNIQVANELEMLKQKVNSIDKLQIELLKSFIQKNYQLQQKIAKAVDKNYFLTQRVQILEEQNAKLRQMVEELFYQREKNTKNNDNNNSKIKQTSKVQTQVQKTRGENQFKHVNDTIQDIPTQTIVKSCLSSANKQPQNLSIKQDSSTRKQTFIHQNYQPIKTKEINSKQNYQSKKQQGNSQQFQQQSQSSQEQSIFGNFIYNQAEKFINNNKKLQKVKNNIEQKYNEFQQVKQITEKSKNKLEQFDLKINQLEAQQKQILNKYQKDIQIMQSYQEKLKQKITALKINTLINSPNQKTNTQIAVKNSQQNINVNQLTAHYAQSMFQLMNSYILSFRIMKTQMFKQDKSVWQSQTSSLLKNVKKVISLFTKVQIIKTGVQIVSYLIGFYIEEEQQTFNQKIYQFITERFLNEKDINEAISQAIILLIEEKYILKTIEKDQDELDLQNFRRRAKAKS